MSAPVNDPRQGAPYNAQSPAWPRQRPYPRPPQPYPQPPRQYAPAPRQPTPPRPAVRRMSKPEALWVTARLKRMILAGSVIGFGAFGALVASHTVGSTATASSQSSQSGQSSTSSNNSSSTSSGGFFSRQGGSNFGSGSGSQAPVTGTSVS